MTATTTVETTTPTTGANIEVYNLNYDVSLNLQRKAVEGPGLSIDFALMRAACQDGTQLLIGAIPLRQYEDGLRADECAENAFLAELSLAEAKQLRAFLNHPEVSCVLDGPKMVWSSDK